MDCIVWVVSEYYFMSSHRIKHLRPVKSTESSEWHRTSMVNIDLERKTLKKTFVWVMEWKCKLCTVSADTWAQLFRHYRLKHSHYYILELALYHVAMTLVFVHFCPFNALKIHLSWFHRDLCRPRAGDRAQAERAAWNSPAHKKHCSLI